MSKQVKLWATKAKTELIEKLGSECAVCGTVFDLQFDCIEPCGDAHHKMSQDQRICFYRKQDKIGNVQLLCKAHHLEKTLKEGQEWREKVYLK